MLFVGILASSAKPNPRKIFLFCNPTGVLVNFFLLRNISKLQTVVFKSWIRDDSSYVYFISLSEPFYMLTISSPHQHILEFVLKFQSLLTEPHVVEPQPLSLSGALQLFWPSDIVPSWAVNDSSKHILRPEGRNLLERWPPDGGIRCLHHSVDSFRRKLKKILPDRLVTTSVLYDVKYLLFYLLLFYLLCL